MIELNEDMKMEQDRNPDGTVRLTLSVDLTYDTRHQWVVRPLLSGVAVIGAYLCKHVHWKWEGGKRYCKGCGQELPGWQSPDLDDSGPELIEGCACPNCKPLRS